MEKPVRGAGDDSSWREPQVQRPRIEKDLLYFKNEYCDLESGIA